MLTINDLCTPEGFEALFAKNAAVHDKVEDLLNRRSQNTSTPLMAMTTQRHNTNLKMDDPHLGG